MSKRPIVNLSNLKHMLGILFAFTGNVYALPCVVTVIKSPCWSDYSVTVNIMDSTYNTLLSKIVITKGTSWQRVTFDCKPSQVLSANASFTPVIWENQKDVIYQSDRFWKLPEKAPEQGALWSINMCYPMQFSNVPSPLDTTNCDCSMDGIPPVENANNINS